MHGLPIAGVNQTGRSRTAQPVAHHVFAEDGVAPCGVVKKYMGDSARQPAVLQNGAAAHGCVKIGTTIF